MTEMGNWLKEQSTGIYMIAYIITFCLRVWEVVVESQKFQEEVKVASSWDGDVEKLEQLRQTAWMIDAILFAVGMWIAYLVVKQRKTFLQKFNFTEGSLTRFVAILIFLR